MFDFLDTDRGNVIRYDSPSLAGFVFSLAGARTTCGDVALRYAGEFNGIKISGGIGYHVERDNNGDSGTHNLGEFYDSTVDFEDIRGSISVLHVPSGLFVDFAGVHREFDDVRYDDFRFWMIRGGIYRKFIALGKTSIFGEYAEAEHNANMGAFFDNGYTVADGTLYGIGINQKIDAAAMELYLGWRHFEVDLGSGYGTAYYAEPTEDIDTVYFGGRIKF